MRRIAKAFLPAAGFLAATGNVSADEGIEFFEKKNSFINLCLPICLVYL